ncbi:MAG: hypothetical protein ACXW2P_13155, partial [Thermoanaerobaculia bacterium]
RRAAAAHMLTPHNLAGLHSTLHVVTEKVDGGPILSLSRAYPVAPFVHEAAATGHLDIVKAYSYAQREWMMRDAWPEMAVAALERLWSAEATPPLSYARFESGGVAFALQMTP